MAIWMSLLSVTVSERSQTQKASCCLILFVWHFRKDKMMGTKDAAIVARAGGCWGVDSLLGDRENLRWWKCVISQLWWWLCGCMYVLKLIEIKVPWWFSWLSVRTFLKYNSHKTQLIEIYTLKIICALCELYFKKIWFQKIIKKNAKAEWGPALLHCWVVRWAWKDGAWWGAGQCICSSHNEILTPKSCKREEESTVQVSLYSKGLKSSGKREQMAISHSPFFYFSTRCHLFSREHHTSFIF